MIQTVVLGLINGVIYALFAIGIALLYRGTRSINFALGEIGTISLYAFWWVSTDRGLPFIVGLGVAIAVGIAIGVGFERFVIRSMVTVDRSTMAVASIGLLTLLLAVEFKFFEASPRSLPAPISGTGVKVSGIFIVPTVWVSVAVLVLAVVGLTQLLRRTDFGLGVLAAAEDPDATRLVGVPVSRVSMFVWGTGAALAVLAMYLLIPSVGGVFRPGLATEIYVKALVGAVVGGLTSIRGAVIGALTVGVAEAAVVRLFSDVDLPGIQLLGLFVIVLAVLLFRPTGLFAAARTRSAA